MNILDEFCPVKGSLVLDGTKPYSCVLNQTEIDSNMNKFYIMQIVKDKDFILYTRYGRTGERGKCLTANHQNQSSAVDAFLKQFKAKTGNTWGLSFVKKPNKYYMSDVSYELDNKIKKDSPKQIKLPASKLSTKVLELISMLTDTKMMQDALITLDIDTKKMPLGKINQSQLNKALNVLSLLEIQVSNNKERINELSSEYYTYVPMAFGRRKPTPIDNLEIVSRYKNTIEELSNMAVTVKMMENLDSDIHPIDSIYNDMDTSIEVLDKNNIMYEHLTNYIKTTHGPTHGFKLEVLDIFSVKQIFKEDKYLKDIPNKTLLFHGCPQNCVASIFKRDFYLDPSKLKDVNVQIAGKMFGYGVYFADSSKSFGYTRAQNTNNIGCFIVAEVALGNSHCIFDADSSLNKDKLEKLKCESTKGVGKYHPENSVVVDDVTIPQGPLKEKYPYADLRYNEFIVYDINQIKIKYLIILKNHGNYSCY
jgi:poly [ADP-ribose] polymerase